MKCALTYDVMDEPVKLPSGNAVGAFHHHHSLATTKAAEASESGAGAGSV